jgi:bisphosphoglycerate-independent phosphoglycerate mutase (AlkP superfamily)
LKRQTLILCSDHGNFEDFSTRSHTRNPVYTIVWGRGQKEFISGIRSIQDITPALVRLLCGEKLCISQENEMMRQSNEQPNRKDFK